MGLGELLKARRKERGLSQKAVAQAIGISQPAYRKIETGQSERSRYERDAARFLGVSTEPDEVRLVGYVGAGAEAHFYAAADDPNEMVQAPEGSTENTVAVEIRGDSLGPLFDRWLVYYDRVEKPVSPALHGRMCVVGLTDDRVLIKLVRPSRTKGLYHLLSNTEPPILDVAIAWAAPIKAMVPR